MRFPALFQRAVTAGPTSWTQDTLPAAPSVATDFLINSRFDNINGWPSQRMAILYTGPASCPNITGQLYCWEDQTQAWHAIGPSLTIKPNVVTFTDIMVPLDYNDVISGKSGAGNSCWHALLLTAPGSSPAVGTYTFAMSPDMTNSP